MRWYWTKIGLGALGIFILGSGLVRAFRGTERAVKRVANASTVSIPLPFVPFVFEGREVGKFRRLTFRRDHGELKGIDISVRLRDASALDGLREGCHLMVDDLDRLGNHTSFNCVEMSERVRKFGQIAIQVRDADGDWDTRARLPLVLPAEVAMEIGEGDVASNAAGIEADQLRALADSIAAVSAKLATADQGERRRLRTELRQLRHELREIESAVAEVSRAMSRVRVDVPAMKIVVPGATVEIPEIKVDVPDAPAVAEAPGAARRDH